MGSIRRVSKDVLNILKVDKKARNSDDYLYSALCKTKLMESGINADRISFVDVMNRRKELGLPPYETVRRARQKAQARHPDLRADADVEAMREVKEEEFRSYAKGVGV